MYISYVVHIHVKNGYLHDSHPSFINSTIAFIPGVSPARRMTREEDGKHIRHCHVKFLKNQFVFDLGSSPTHMELPWKRDEENDSEHSPVRQH